MVILRNAIVFWKMYVYFEFDTRSYKFSQFLNFLHYVPTKPSHFSDPLPVKKLSLIFIYFLFLALKKHKFSSLLLPCPNFSETCCWHHEKNIFYFLIKYGFTWHANQCILFIQNYAFYTGSFLVWKWGYTCITITLCTNHEQWKIYFVWICGCNSGWTVQWRPGLFLCVRLHFLWQFRRGTNEHRHGGPSPNPTEGTNGHGVSGVLFISTQCCNPDVF